MRKATGAKKASTAVKAAPASHGPPKRASPSSNNSRSRATLAVSASDIGFGAPRPPTFIVQSPRSAAKPLCISQDRKGVVSGKRGSVRVDIGGRRTIKKKKKKQK